MRTSELIDKLVKSLDSKGDLDVLVSVGGETMAAIEEVGHEKFPHDWADEVGPYHFVYIEVL